MGALNQELGYEGSLEQMQSRFKRISRRAGNGLFVAILDGNVDGWLHVQAQQSLESEPVAEIMRLVVAHMREGAVLDAHSSIALADGLATSGCSTFGCGRISTDNRRTLSIRHWAFVCSKRSTPTSVSCTMAPASPIPRNVKRSGRPHGLEASLSWISRRGFSHEQALFADR